MIFTSVLSGEYHSSDISLQLETFAPFPAVVSEASTKFFIEYEMVTSLVDIYEVE